MKEGWPRDNKSAVASGKENLQNSRRMTNVTLQTSEEQTAFEEKSNKCVALNKTKNQNLNRQKKS